MIRNVAWRTGPHRAAPPAPGGLARQDGALEEHTQDLGPQGAHAPALAPAHLGVEVALEVILEINDLDKMTPAQLSRQCRDNLPVGEDLGEAEHAGKIGPGKPVAELGSQFVRQCRTNLAPK